MTTHGHATSKLTPTYQSWQHMVQRCTNPNDDAFHCYGGRGIRVCDRWLSFESFLADMGERPEGTSIEREDVNGSYEPRNCRWATKRDQSFNRRTNKLERHEPAQIAWLRSLGVPIATVATFFGIHPKAVRPTILMARKHGECP